MNIPPSLRRRVLLFAAGVLLVVFGAILLVGAYRDIVLFKTYWPRRAVTGLSMQLPGLPLAAPADLPSDSIRQIVKVERHELRAEECEIAIRRITFREVASLEAEAAAVAQIGNSRLVRKVTTDISVQNHPAKRVEIDYHVTGHFVRHLVLCVTRDRIAWRVSVIGQPEAASRIADRLFPTVEFSD